MVSCDQCHRRLECLKLSVCVDLLNTVHDAVLDDVMGDKIKEFKNKIEETGYSYPVGEVFCQLAKTNQPLDPFYRKAKRLFSETTTKMKERSNL